VAAATAAAVVVVAAIASPAGKALPITANSPCFLCETCASVVNVC
jgi:hypothetical protein